MRKLFSFDKSQSYFFLTVICILFIGAGYFFMYVPRNEKLIQEERFRTLQNMVLNIRTKIDNSFKLLNNLLPDTGFNLKLDVNKINKEYNGLLTLVQ